MGLAFRYSLISIMQSNEFSDGTAAVPINPILQVLEATIQHETPDTTFAFIGLHLVRIYHTSRERW